MIKRTRASGLSLAAVALLGMTATTARGTIERTWIGPTVGDQVWNDPANWSDNDVPDDGFWYLPQGEKATIGVDELAKILRTNAAAIRRAIRMPDFPIDHGRVRSRRALMCASLVLCRSIVTRSRVR